jgi:ABC-type sugar transport system ATPase subunit
MPDLLKAENISKHYGGVAALRNAWFSLRTGEVHALVGENGAGKSTLARILAGSAKADSGAIFIHGERVEWNTPLDAQRAGVAIISQELDLFPSLSIGENLVVGNLCFGQRSFVAARRIEEFCRPYLNQVGLKRPAQTPLARLSIGEMQLVAIARALSLKARVILMDEPTSSLFEDAVERLFHLIARLKSSGVAIAFVSHKMDEIFRICDRVTVLRDGETVGVRDIGAASPREIIRMMAGRDVNFSKKSDRAPGPVLLEARNLSTRKLKQVCFELRRGEVLGVAGLVGSGRSELGAALFGLDRITGGELRLNGRPFRPRSPRDAIRRGLGLLPEDRKLQGLMMHMSALENTTIGALYRMRRFGFVRRAEERRQAAPLWARLNLKCGAPSSPVAALSGGNQQKTLLARWLLLSPDALFLDDPARGIDVGAKEDIYGIIDELARQGKGVILVSSELPELLRCSDRIVVLKDGRLTAAFDAASAAQDVILAAATSEAAP